MGKGIYSGGHTKIMISAEGTAWPTSFDDPGVSPSELRRRKPQKTWSGALSNDPPPSRAPNDELRHVILCARAYKDNRLTEAFPEPPNELKEIVKGYGGNASWLLASETRKNKFVAALEKARDRDWTKKPAPRPQRKAKKLKGSKTFELKR